MLTRRVMLCGMLTLMPTFCKSWKRVDKCSEMIACGVRVSARAGRVRLFELGLRPDMVVGFGFRGGVGVAAQQGLVGS